MQAHLVPTCQQSAGMPVHHYDEGTLPSCIFLSDCTLVSPFTKMQHPNLFKVPASFAGVIETLHLLAQGELG